MRCGCSSSVTARQRRQRAVCRALGAGTSSGSAARHSGSTSGQRGPNEQPGGGFSSDGGEPWMGVSGLPSSSGFGTEPSRPIV
jgi:hypothetical protein